MQQLILNIKDESQLPFLTELLAHFDFVEVLKPQNGNGQKRRKRKLTAAEQEFVDGLKQALREVELHQQGKIQLKTLREVLAEL
ncbi:MAG: hypothetical protein ACK4Q5_04420 [Saprospiraceae bacterium]